MNGSTSSQVAAAGLAAGMLFVSAAAIFRLKRQVAHLKVLREDERRGRTSAEKALRLKKQGDEKINGYAFDPIGVMRTPFRDRRGTPRQGTVAPAAEATLHLNKSSIPPGTLDSLPGFSHVWVVFVFHENTVGARRENGGGGVEDHDGPKKKEKKPQKASTFSAKVTPPRLGRKVGVFSTRSPHRPNPIGLSVCSLLGVDERACTVRLGGVDLVDGTPVLDIKPYVPYDSVPDCRVPSWVLPPKEGDLASGLPVRFANAAREGLAEAFAVRRPKPGVLAHFADRPAAFETCLEQVVRQDPRSLVRKGDGDIRPFALVVDGLEATFEARSTAEGGTEMVVTAIVEVIQGTDDDREDDTQKISTESSSGR